MKPEQLEIAQLRREVVRLKAERDILKSRGLLRDEEFDAKFGFHCEAPGDLAGGMVVRGARVSRGGFYAWLTRPRSRRSRSDEELGAKVRASFLASDRTYGVRRVWHDMLAEGVSCGLHRIERLMRLQALKARPRRRRLPPDLGERRGRRRRSQRAQPYFRTPAPPMVHCFLTLNCQSDVVVLFAVNKYLDPYRFVTSFHQSRRDAETPRRGKLLVDAGIEDAVAPIGHEVEPRRLHAAVQEDVDGRDKPGRDGFEHSDAAVGRGKAAISRSTRPGC